MVNLEQKKVFEEDQLEGGRMVMELRWNQRKNKSLEKNEFEDGSDTGSNPIKGIFKFLRGAI